jgi:hypothetical protein
VQVSVQMPSWQSSDPWHAVVQLPQWVALVSVLTQTPLQFVSVGAHVTPPSPGVESLLVSPDEIVSLELWSDVLVSGLA